MKGLEQIYGSAIVHAIKRRVSKHGKDKAVEFYKRNNLEKHLQVFNKMYNEN